MSRYSKPFILSFLIFLTFSCEPTEHISSTSEKANVDLLPVSDYWKNAIVYFLLTDRFNNGDPSNDEQYNRTAETAVLRGFEGGDIRGITNKIKEGYFTDLGVNAIWTTPIIEQVHDYTDEGTGVTYAYHGYWAKDWTALDPNFGTEEDFSEMVSTAHSKGIKILMDVVINHTGPVTKTDTQWPDDWVRMTPTCTYKDFESTVTCTLVDNLPDIKTESDEPVELPKFLIDKWKSEGRLEAELASLDAFFARTGYPRAPRFYIIKWFSDWVEKYGIDGFRIDTAKHTEAKIWAELKKECQRAYDLWRKKHPELVKDEEPFYMVGEVYNYDIDGGKDFDYGDKSVDFYNYGFESLINFDLKETAKLSYEEIFSKYSQALNNGPMKGVSILNYLSSHDDGGPFDKDRSRTYEAGTKLLLCPGAVQIYYGDESARPLIIEGTQGDATLRSNMNWDDIESDDETKVLLSHWHKLGQFRHDHLSIGAGIHEKIHDSPYIFKRVLIFESDSDKTVVGLDLPIGPKQIDVAGIFEDDVVLLDYYSNNKVVVKSGKVELDTPYEIVLLGIE